jgi:hypothetical protein
MGGHTPAEQISRQIHASKLEKGDFEAFSPRAGTVGEKRGYNADR